MLVALSLVRELGPVVSALLFASRAGSAMTAEIGLMKATEQISAMEMMAVDPIARVIAPRFWAGVISMPLLAAMFSAMGVFGGYLVGVVLIGVDEGAFWSQMQSAVDLREDIAERRHQERGVRRRGDRDRAVRRLRCAADRGGRVGRDHAHRGDLVARHTGAGFRADRIHVQRGLSAWKEPYSISGSASSSSPASRALFMLALKVGNASATFSTRRNLPRSRPSSTTSAASRCARR